MGDLISFIAYGVLGACISAVAVGTGIAIGGNGNLYLGLTNSPAHYLEWAIIAGAVAGLAFRVTKD